MPNAIITGACKDGYGEAITKLLLEHGYTVFGTFDQALAEKASSMSHQRLNLFEVDHASRRSLQHFVDEISGVDISALVNAEMYFNMEDPDNFDHDEWEKSIFVNLTAPNFLFHELKRQMVDGASVVTVTSAEALGGSFGASAYTTTKAAIHNLVKTHANIVGGKGIRVNAVAPGWIGGVMDTDEVFNLSREITPLGRLGSPEEVANAVYFMLSEASSFVNGTVLVADGGYSGVDTISKFEFDEARKA